jgi:hypothetical protein
VGWRFTAAVALTALVAMVACGGPAAPARGPSTAAVLKAKTDYAACMRRHGVAMNNPDDNGDLTFGGLVDRSAFLTAQAACRSVWPTSSGWKVDQIIEHQAQAVRMSSCLKQHGISVTTSGGGTDIRLQPSPGSSPGAVLDTAAMQACQAEAGPAVMIKQPGH